MRKNGFTLLELVIVMAIIGILATAGFFSFDASFRNARDGKRKADLEQIRGALELYRSDSDDGKYIDAGWTDLSDSGSAVYAALVGGGYLTSMPLDPKNNNQWPGCGSAYTKFAYYYRANAGATQYDLVTGLESRTATTNCPAWCGINPVPASCYIVTSP